MQAPDPPGDEARLCTRFIDALPDELPTVGTRRTVSDESGLTAAYGDPPVAIRCGVPDPPGLRPTSTLVSVQGVDWLPEELSAGWRLTTIGLAANVELTVPTQQGPAPSVAVDIEPSLRAAIPVSGAAAAP